MSRTGFVAIARRPAIVRRAARVAAVVGTILAIINHAPALLAGTFDLVHAAQTLLTYLVPYCVATWSAVATVRELENAARG